MNVLRNKSDDRDSTLSTELSMKEVFNAQSQYHLVFMVLGLSGMIFLGRLLLLWLAYLPAFRAGARYEWSMNDALTQDLGGRLGTAHGTCSCGWKAKRSRRPQP